MMCCGRSKRRANKETGSSSPGVSIEDAAGTGASSKELPLTKHPSETNVSLSTHQPLYPPGSIIHIVRQHTKRDSNERSESAVISFHRNK